MKIEVRLDPEYAEPKLLILADSMSEEVERILRLLRSEPASRRLPPRGSLAPGGGGHQPHLRPAGQGLRRDGLRRIRPPPEAL